MVLVCLLLEAKLSDYLSADAILGGAEAPGIFVQIEPKAVLRVVERERRPVNSERRYFTPGKLADGQSSHTRGKYKHEERKER